MGNFWKGIIVALIPAVLSVATGLIVMHSDLSVAQQNDKTAKERLDKHERELKVLTEVAATLQSVNRALEKLDGRLDKVDQYIAEDQVRDAKNHHNHPNRND